jgi:oligosaccharide repeat unit polymerase
LTDIQIIEKIIAIIFSLGILSIGILVAKWLKTFLNPTTIFCFFWFLYTFFPLIFVINVPVNALSIIFIFIALLFFSISIIFFKWNIAFVKNQLKRELESNLFSNSFMINMNHLMFIIIIICLIIDIYIQGFTIFDFTGNFFESSNKFMVKRYSDEIIPNPFSQILNILNYSLNILGGIVLGSKIENKKTKIKLLIINILPAAIITLTQAAKGTILLSIVLFFSGILISRVFKHNLELTNKKTNKLLFWASISLLIILLISFLSRGLYELEGSDLISTLKYNFNSYAFGHIYAFSDWFSFYLFSESMEDYVFNGHTNGFYTFMSIFKAFGDTTFVPPGVFTEYFSYNNILQTNIYTFFRGTITDFGIFGSFIFCFFLGLISNFTYYCILYFKKPIWSISLFSILLGFYYTSFIISLFIWKSVFITILVVSVILKINYLKIKY